MNKQTQTFNFYCSYFSSYIISSLLQILRLRNLAWDVFGVNFWSGFFWGVLLEALRIFLGFDFCPHSIIPVTWNPEYPQPWGEGELIQSCTLYMISMKLQTIVELKYLKEGVTNTNGKRIFIFPFWIPTVTFAKPASQMPCYSTWISWLSVGGGGEGGGLLTGEWQYHEPGSAAAPVL